jgi:hypothetical protein
MPWYRATIYGDREPSHTAQRGRLDEVELGPVLADGIAEAAAQLLDRWFRDFDRADAEWRRVVVAVQETTEDAALPSPAVLTRAQPGLYTVEGSSNDLRPDPLDERGSDELVMSDPKRGHFTADTAGDAIREWAAQEIPAVSSIEITVSRGDSTR